MSPSLNATCCIVRQCGMVGIPNFLKCVAGFRLLFIGRVSASVECGFDASAADEGVGVNSDPFVQKRNSADSWMP